MQPAGLNPYVLHEVLEKDKFSSGIIITFQVMAVARVSPGDPDPIRTVPECGQYKFGAHPGGARNPNNPDIGWVLETAYAGQVGGAITAPVTEESRDFRLPVIHAQLLFLTLD